MDIKHGLKSRDPSSSGGHCHLILLYFLNLSFFGFSPKSFKDNPPTSHPHRHRIESEKTRSFSVRFSLKACCKGGRLTLISCSTQFSVTAPAFDPLCLRSRSLISLSSRMYLQLRQDYDVNHGPCWSKPELFVVVRIGMHIHVRTCSSMLTHASNNEKRVFIAEGCWRLCCNPWNPVSNA